MKKTNILKSSLLCIALLYFLLLIIPLALYGISPNRRKNSANPLAESIPADNSHEEYNKIPDFLSESAFSPISSYHKENEEIIFKIYDESSNQELSVSAKEFLYAAVACEMPLSAPDEALKAQAVAAYTYYIREKNNNSGGADFTCNSDEWLTYVTKEKMKERWGDDFDTYYQRLESIIDSVYGQIIIKNNEPICATYFAISSGSTETSENVWGGNLPYLQTVASPGDAMADGYLSSMKFTAEDIENLLKKALPETVFDFSSPKSEWFQNQKTSSAGYTIFIEVCGSEIHGTKLRTALSLSSTCFDISFDEPYFTFSVRGRGHGVGLSQAGAMFMAQHGNTYTEILSHYYPETVIKNFYSNLF